MENLYKKITTLLLLLVMIPTVFAQQEKMKKYSFGFQLSKTSHGNLFRFIPKETLIPYNLSEVSLGAIYSYGLGFKCYYKLFKQFSVSSGLSYLNYVIRARVINHDLNKGMESTLKFNSFEVPIILLYRIKLKTETYLIPYLGYVLALNAIKPQTNVFHIYDPTTGYEDRMYYRRTRITGHGISYGLELENDFKKAGKIRIGLGATANFFSAFKLVSMFYDPFFKSRQYKFGGAGINYSPYNPIIPSYVSMHLTYILPSNSHL